MKRQLRASLLATLSFLTPAASGLTITPAVAQVCGSPALTVQPKIVWEEEIQTRYRLVNRVEMQDSEVVSQRPVLKYRTEKRSYTVTKPVQETSTVQEKYTVMVPVRKQELVDRSYYKTD
ncbi:MAG: hypothetical protein IT423_21515, partial [Pirellulaceae bacterium]|nr:hypothetical protein [Pirellulaceae bacterium]